MCEWGNCLYLAENKELREESVTARDAKYATRLTNLNKCAYALSREKSSPGKEARIGSFRDILSALSEVLMPEACLSSAYNLDEAVRNIQSQS